MRRTIVEWWRRPWTQYSLGEHGDHIALGEFER
jgi:hypothetical protein